MLSAQIAAAKAEHGHCLLVDFHSMPPRDRTNRQLADIILGIVLAQRLILSLATRLPAFLLMRVLVSLGTSLMLAVSSPANMARLAHESVYPDRNQQVTLYA